MFARLMMYREGAVAAGPMVLMVILVLVVALPLAVSVRVSHGEDYQPLPNPDDGVVGGGGGVGPGGGGGGGGGGGDGGGDNGPPDREPQDHREKCCADKCVDTRTCGHDFCMYCCGDQHVYYRCNMPPPNPIYLAAQIALGTALVVAVAAVVSVALRACASRRAARIIAGSAESRAEGLRAGPRPSRISLSSAELFYAQRLHDRPPSYDEISWEKPPSYSSINTLQESVSGAEAAQADQPDGESQPRQDSDHIFSISQQLHQMQHAQGDGQAQIQRDTEAH